MTFVSESVSAVSALLARSRSSLGTESGFLAMAELSAVHGSVVAVLDRMLQKEDPETFPELLQILLDFSLYSRLAGTQEGVLTRLSLARNLLLAADEPHYAAEIGLELGAVLRSVGEFNKAADSCREVIEQNGWSGDSYPEESLNVSRALAVSAVTASLVGLAVRYVPPVLARVQARAHLMLADVLRITGHTTESLAQVNLADRLCTAQQEADALLQGEVNYLLGESFRAMGDINAAHAQFTQALSQYQGVLDRGSSADRGVALLGKIKVKLSLGDASLRSLDAQAAREHYNHAHEIAQAIANSQGLANASLCLVRLELLGNGFDASILRKINAVQNSFRVLHDLLGSANTHMVLGDYYALSEQRAHARRAYKHAQDICYRLDTQGMLDAVTSRLKALTQEVLPRNAFSLPLEQAFTVAN